MRKLPTLEELRVATPCMVAWDSMVGDDRVRRCDTCKQNVYNISQLTRAQADELIAAKDAQMCMRYFHLADGTILLRDGAVAYRPTGLATAATAALALAGAVAWPEPNAPLPAARVVEPTPAVPMAPVVPSIPSFSVGDQSTPSIPLHLPVVARPHVPQLPQRVFVTGGVPPLPPAEIREVRGHVHRR
jgi:hypothetical protein